MLCLENCRLSGTRFVIAYGWSVDAASGSGVVRVYVAYSQSEYPMFASTPAPRPRSRNVPKISKTAAFTRMILIIGATLGSLVLAIRFSSSDTCAEVVCRLDESHATTGLAVVATPPAIPPRAMGTR